MSLHDDNPHESDSPQELDPGWFVSAYEAHSNLRFSETVNDSAVEALKVINREMIDALRAFYERSTSVEESAHSITRPISTSSVPPIGTLADQSVALRHLWDILTGALFEWPSSRTSDVIDLLSAIKHLPKTVQIHKGEATDIQTGERVLTWDMLPWFYMVWDEWVREPSEIVRQQWSGTEVSPSEFIRSKDLHARLIASGVLALDRIRVDFVARALEPELEPAACPPVPGAEAAAFSQSMLELQIPAIASWIKRIGTMLLDWEVRTNGDQQRWTRWEERLQRISDDNSDGPTRAAARAAYAEMRAIGARDGTTGEE